MGTIKITCNSGQPIVLQQRETNKVFAVLEDGESFETGSHDFFITEKRGFRTKRLRYGKREVS